MRSISGRVFPTRNSEKGPVGKVVIRDWLRLQIKEVFSMVSTLIIKRTIEQKQRG